MVAENAGGGGIMPSGRAVCDLNRGAVPEFAQLSFILERIDMYRTIFAMLLVAISSSASATWIKTESDNAGSFYEDTSNYQKKGALLKAQYLIDFRVAVPVDKGRTSLSIKYDYEFNCKDRKFRMVAATIYSKNMAEGEILVIGPGPWKVPESSDNSLSYWTTACKKTKDNRIGQ